MKPLVAIRWAVAERASDACIDGAHEALLWSMTMSAAPLLFRTRAEARAYIAKQYGDLPKRPDLRAHPHGWLMPRPARCRVVIEATE